MELHLIIDGKQDLAGQVYRQLKEAIRSGRLPDGQQVPPSRLLAQQLGLSRKTVARAYAKLGLEQLLSGQVGKGSFVCAPPAAAARRQTSDDLASHATLRKWNAMQAPLRHEHLAGHARYEFLGGMPAVSHFPQLEWRRCLLQALRQEASLRGRHSDTQGLAPLRAAIARHIGYARGVVCDATQVVVSNGAQQALDLLGRVLLEPGSVVAMEDPGYPPARLLYASQGARVVGVPVDAEGMQVALIPAETRLIYVTPAHQMPLGMPMSLARRHALLQRARAIGAIVVEDDYDSEFRYEGRPADSLQSLDRHGIVVFVGSFSKVLLPELRMGYVVAPEAVLGALLTAKHLSDWHVATLTQLALARFIEQGLLQKHIRRCHTVYSSRRAQLQLAFDELLAPWLTLVPATAGFHLAALARDGLDVDLLLRLARRADIGLTPLAPFYHQAAPQAGLFLGYGAIDTLDIRPALLRLRDILLQMEAD